MATYKAEFLSHYWEGRPRPRSAYAFGLIDQWARLASLWPGLVNLATQTPGLAHLAKLAAGMPLERRIPEFAPQTFRQWFRNWPQSAAGESGTVLLWPDTFNNYFFPETAQAAAQVLQAAGFSVEIPQMHLCCGRPLYDFGMLEKAKLYLRRILQALSPQIWAGVPMVVLEPSCASVFRDELHNLFPDDPLAQKLRDQTFLLSEFLEKRASHHALPQWKRRALVHGHCHHKSLLKMDAEKSVLKKLGLQCEIVTSGCCGMAGSFGFEKDKYDVSVAVGEHVLLPAVRKAGLSTVIISDGFSCREQIAQLTGRRALHLAEVIQMAQQEGPYSGPETYPEAKLMARRQAAMRRARWQTVGAMAGMAFGAVLLAKWIKR